MRMLNLGILAHVDAGKTSLTERLLYAAGVIDEIGSVDHGSTQTDSLALERQRGITIKSAVVSFVIDDVTVNLIDTPGHPDFIAEVERVLNVLDGAVLVISAVEGVQSQTRVLIRTLQRLRIPTIIFVNKIDRGGAQYEPVLQDIATKLTPAIVAMGAADGLGTRSPAFTPFRADDAAFSARLTDVLAQTDDAFLTAYLENGANASHYALRAALAEQTKQARVHPVFFGSAIRGAGVDSLTAGITEFLPAAEGDTEGPLSGSIFKIERGPSGEKLAYVRMFRGSVAVREKVRFGEDRDGKITAISLFEHGAAVPRASITAGQIGVLRGLGDIQIGDALGTSASHAGGHYFAPPTLESMIVPQRTSDMGALHGALAQLAEQDPLINLRQEDVRQELFVSLYGEVQKEVIQETLAADFNIAVEFRETTTICVERPVGAGEAFELMRGRGNPFLATVGLRIEPGAIDSGVQFRLAVEVHGTMPPAFFTAVEDTVQATLRQGLYGWQVTDCIVTMTHTGYSPRGSHAHQGFSKSMSSTGADFRGLTPLVVMSALQRAGTTVYEPIHRFRLELPADTFGAAAPVLARLRAIAHTQETHGAAYVLDGDVPAAQVHELQQQLPALTRGEGVVESAFDRYLPVVGEIPMRPRTDNNPLNRRAYLLHVLRRV